MYSSTYTCLAMSFFKGVIQGDFVHTFASRARMGWMDGCPSTTSTTSYCVRMYMYNFPQQQLLNADDRSQFVWRRMCVWCGGANANAKKKKKDTLL